MTDREKVVSIAAQQIGNVGGQKFWSWYGFSYRVAWCACYVSWVLRQAGVKKSVCFNYCYCPTAVNWFKAQGIWKGRDYKPSPGDIIMFDWENDGVSDHTGIVERCAGGIVYTIEGNSGDQCRRKSYAVGSSVIMGYGVPKYENNATIPPDSNLNTSDVYIVKAGDTLSSIANRYGTTVKYLVELNRIKDANVINVGQTIKLKDIIDVSGYPTLRKGSKGDYVKKVQQNLIARKYGLKKADGKFGGNTDREVRNFQEIHRLEIDGIVGPATWKELSK